MLPRLISAPWCCSVKRTDCDASHSSVLSVSSSSSFSVSLLGPDILLSICSRYYQTVTSEENNAARNVAKNLRTSGECKPNIFISKSKARVDIWQSHLEERLKSQHTASSLLLLFDYHTFTFILWVFLRARHFLSVLLPAVIVMCWSRLFSSSCNILHINLYSDVFPYKESQITPFNSIVVHQYAHNPLCAYNASRSRHFRAPNELCERHRPYFPSSAC
jgi:hypothetical protein